MATAGPTVPVHPTAGEPRPAPAVRGFLGSGGRAAVVAAAAIALGWFAVYGGLTTWRQQRASTVTAWSRTDLQRECLYHQLRSRLPAHTDVYIADPVPLDAQLLAELVTPWATPRVGPSGAQWKVSLAMGGSCQGLSVRVGRL